MIVNAKWIGCCLCVFVLCVPLSLSLAGEMDSVAVELPHSGNGFRSVQADAVSILFMSGVAVAVDYDLARLSNRSTIGLRSGIEYYSVIGVDNTFSPYIDYECLVRSTSGGSRFRWDIYTGIASHHSTIRSSYEPKTGFKFGMDFRYYLVPQYCALLLKLNIGAIGLGVSLGYDRW